MTSGRKSSTTRMIAAILARHGHYVGTYLSPHLVGFNERIRVDDEDITAQQMVITESFRRHQPQRLSEIASDDIIFAHFEWAAIASPHMKRGVVTQNRGHRHLFIARFVVAIDLP